MPGPHECTDLRAAYWQAVADHGADSPEAKAAAAAFWGAGCPADPQSGGAGNHGGDPPQ